MINLLVSALVIGSTNQENALSVSELWINRAWIDSYKKTGVIGQLPRGVREVSVPIEHPQAATGGYKRDLAADKAYENEVLPKLVKEFRTMSVKIAFRAQVLDCGAVASSILPEEDFEETAFAKPGPLFFRRFISPARCSRRLNWLGRAFGKVGTPSTDRLILNFGHSANVIFHHSLQSRRTAIEAIGFDPGDFYIRDVRTLTNGFQSERAESAMAFTKFRDLREREFFECIRQAKIVFKDWALSPVESAANLFFSDVQRLGIGFGLKTMLAASGAKTVYVAVNTLEEAQNLQTNFPKSFRAAAVQIVVVSENPMLLSAIRRSDVISGLSIIDTHKPRPQK